MKLSLGVLAALAGVNEAVVTCSGGKAIFEATCDSNGFKILINEACRAEGFAGVDFPNSFVWGVNTVTTMAVPGCTAPCVPTDVVAGATETCSSIKPSTAAGTVDGDGTQTYQWLVPLTECGVVASQDTTDPANVFTKYDLYLNSNSGVDTLNTIVQMEQVKFTCKLEPFQEDAGAVTVSQGDLVSDAAFKLDLRSLVTLEVSTAGADTLNPNTAATAYDGSTAMLTMATAGATTANIGDHVELRLKDVAPATALTSYALSLYRCWASKDAKATTAGEETLTGADTALEFEFWDEFCPKYNWVAPESGATTGSGYLKTHWDRATSLHAINFRQFAFLDSGFTIGTDTISYHCYVKVCPIADVATCSTKNLADTANTCVAPTYYNPAGRRRRDAERERTRRSELDGSTLVEVTKTITTPSVAPEDCHTIVDGACIVQKDETPRSSSKHVAAASGLAAFLAAINL
jgi:hypothetical protein